MASLRSRPKHSDSGGNHGRAPAFIVGLLILALFIPASGWTATTYYNVPGANLQAVSDNIFGDNGQAALGPDGRAGEAVMSMTQDYKTTKKTVDGDCVVTVTAGSVVFTLTCDILLPKWTGYDNGTDKEKTEWNRFIAALTVHENGHCTRYLAHQAAIQAAAAALDGKSVTIEGPCPEGCPGIETVFGKAVAKKVDDLANANAAYSAEYTASDTEQQNYDTTTDHGATQGATLEPNP